jgi:hypothetical protein
VVPGPDNIIKCPKCSLIAKNFSIASTFTFSITTWTDGRIYNPLFPDVPIVTKCTDCGYVYWVDDNIIGSMNPFNTESVYPEAWKEARYIDINTIQDYIEAIKLGIGITKQKELDIRKRLWWSINDLHRNTDSTKVDLDVDLIEQHFVSNLKGLYEILDPSKYEDRILRAEILRELGDFADSIQILNNDIPEAYRQITQKILQLALEGKQEVASVD